jgi:presequence protease
MHNISNRSTAGDVTITNIYHGFRFTDRRFVGEVNSECLYFIHEKSGARLFKIAASDTNKLFSITFKTVPENDWGTPHILEHSVLNGSRSFPVKSPFDILLKGSLNTFMNAMTAADHTTYPVASMNTKDYFNLMHVYLDAVFKPLMLEDPNILKQEGWHYELTDRDDSLSYKGVVYNEMKGSFSNPLYQLYYFINKHLFPENAYGYSSGGHPDAIPGLTQEYFCSYHQRYYHPSNSYILLYGDADLMRELEFINENYLRDYNRLADTIEIPLQTPFQSLKTIEESYAVPDGSPLKDNTYLSLCFVTNDYTDRITSMAFDIIVNALINHETAPVRIALQEAGIGKEVMGWFSENQQSVISIIVPNANPEDRDRFLEVTMAAIIRTVESGFDKSTIEGIVNRNEFQLKEGDTAQKGLMYFDLMVQDWLFREDPYSGLEYGETLSELKRNIESNYLETLTRQHLIDNKHSLLLAMKPEAGLQTARDSILDQNLKYLRDSLTHEEIGRLVKETHELLEYQQREDSPEALSTIPMLQLSDIPEKAQFPSLNKFEIGGIPLMHHDQFTNNILYTSFYFDLGGIPEEKISYAALLATLLGKLGTSEYDFGVLENELNIYTGGFNARLATYLGYRSDNNLIPKLVVSIKAVLPRTEKMMSLLFEIVLNTIYNDKERLHSVLKRHQSQLDANIRQNGMNYAINRAASQYSNRGVFNELTAGVAYYRFITGLCDNFDEKSEEIIGQLEQLSRIVFSRENLTVQVTCSSDDMFSFTGQFEKQEHRLVNGTGIKHQWNLSKSSKKNEAILSAAQVQYIAKGYDFKKLGYDWSGKMYVLSQILSTDWLQNQIRVMGGAYGAFCGFAPNGNAYFASYRDPNLKETLEIIDATTGYVRNFNSDEAAMTRYIIGTIAGLDQPKTASQSGAAAMHYHFEKTTVETVNRERSEILNTTPADIRNMAAMTEDILKQNVYCVYGNEGKISKVPDLFDELIRISETETETEDAPIDISEEIITG